MEFIIAVNCILPIVVIIYFVCLLRLLLNCYKTIDSEKNLKRPCKNNECMYYNQVLPVLSWPRNTNIKINKFTMDSNKNNMPDININSFNGRGLRNKNKINLVFKWLNTSHIGMTMLQETHAIIFGKTNGKEKFTILMVNQIQRALQCLYQRSS